MKWVAVSLVPQKGPQSPLFGAVRHTDSGKETWRMRHDVRRKSLLELAGWLCPHCALVVYDAERVVDALNQAYTEIGKPEWDGSVLDVRVLGRQCGLDSTEMAELAEKLGVPISVHPDVITSAGTVWRVAERLMAIKQ